MPPKKSPRAKSSSPEKSKASPDRKKGSPNRKKGSPEKKKGSPRKKGKNQSPEKPKVDEEIVLPRRPRPPPTPPPPEGPSDTKIFRQNWYAYTNKATSILEDYGWAPHYPLATSWGDIIVSDPPRRRLCRYELCRRTGDFKKIKDIIVRGHPYNLCEMPKSGRILTSIKCPLIKKCRIGIFNVITGEMEHKVDFPHEPAEPANPPLSAYNESEIVGVTAGADMIVIIRCPMQSFIVLHSKTYERLTDLRFQSSDKYRSSCMHITLTGGCVMNDTKLYLTATRPNRIVCFEIIKEMVYDMLDRVTFRYITDIGMNRMQSPRGLSIDGRGLLIVTDAMWNFVKIFRHDGKCTGNVGEFTLDIMQLKRPGHISISRHGVLAVVDHHANDVKVCVDRQIFSWYYDSLLKIDTLPFGSKSAVNRFLPKKPPPVDTFLSELSYDKMHLTHTYSRIDVREEDEEPKVEEPKQKSPKKKSPKKKSPPKRSPPKKSPAQKTPKKKKK